MPKTLALIGGSGFQPGDPALGRWLLERVGGEPPRGLVVPTAASRDNPYRAVRVGTTWFQHLGAEMDALMIVDQVTGDYRPFVELAESCEFFFLMDGDVRYLVETLRGTRGWAVIERKYREGEAVVAGAGAGAAALGEWVEDTAGEVRPGLNLARVSLVSDAASLPEGAIRLVIPNGSAALYYGTAWRVHGPGPVTVIERGIETQVGEGAAFAAG